ncbi:hypothetical protein DV736_g2052, partial [Chaetothyriales sp. CBS 134916]
MANTAMTDGPVKDPSPSPTCTSEQTVTWTPTQVTHEGMESASSHLGQTQLVSHDQSSREGLGSNQEHQLAETSPEFDLEVNKSGDDNSHSGTVTTTLNATHDPLGLGAYKSDSQSATSDSPGGNRLVVMVKTRYRLDFTGPAFPTVKQPALPNLADCNDPTGINDRRLANYRSFEANEAFLMTRLYGIDSKLFGPRFHTRFLIKTIGTIQCDQCKSKNTHSGGEVYKCHTCASQICRACVVERLSREEYDAANPPEEGGEPYVWEWNGVGTHEGFKLCYLERRDKAGGQGSWSVQFVGYADDKLVVPNGVVEMVMSADGQGGRKRKQAEGSVTEEKEKVKAQRQEGPEDTMYAANVANTGEQRGAGLQTWRPGANWYYHPATQSHPQLFPAETLQYEPTEYGQSNVQMPPALAELGNNRAITQGEQAPRRFSKWDGKEIRGYVYNPQQQSRSNDQKPATLGTSESSNNAAVTQEEQAPRRPSKWDGKEVRPIVYNSEDHSRSNNQAPTTTVDTSEFGNTRTVTQEEIAPKRFSKWDGKEIQPYVYNPEYHWRSNVQRAAAAPSTGYAQNRERSSEGYNYGRPSFTTHGLINRLESMSHDLRRHEILPHHRRNVTGVFETNERVHCMENEDPAAQWMHGPDMSTHAAGRAGGAHHPGFSHVQLQNQGQTKTGGFFEAHQAAGSLRSHQTREYNELTSAIEDHGESETVDMEEYYGDDETLVWGNGGHDLNNDVPSFTGFDDLTFIVPNLVYGFYPSEPNVEQPAPQGNDLWQALLDASNDAYAELMIEKLEGLTWAEMTPAQLTFAEELGRRGAYTEHERAVWQMLREMRFNAGETTDQENGTAAGSETEASSSSVTRESETKTAIKDDDETVDEDAKSQDEACPACPAPATAPKILYGGRLRNGKEYTS